MIRRYRTRPLGEVAQAFLRTVPTLAEPTVRDVAQRIRLPYAAARRLASELCGSGWLRYSDRTVPTATRPARVLQVVAESPQQTLYRADDLAGVFGLMVRSGRD